jgi:hypothetical protein
MLSLPFIFTIFLLLLAVLLGEQFICLPIFHYFRFILVPISLFWFLFLCFGSIETPKHAVSILIRNNRNKRLVSDSIETSFGSSFGCFESKLVS